MSAAPVSGSAAGSAAGTAVREQPLHIPRYRLLLMTPHFQEANSRLGQMDYPLPQEADVEMLPPQRHCFGFFWKEGSFWIISTSSHFPQRFLSFCIIFCSKIRSIITFSVTQRPRLISRLDSDKPPLQQHLYKMSEQVWHIKCSWHV